MASNYTEHYQLPIWSPEDSFLREEFNESHQKIDAALAGLAEENFQIGSYTSTDTGTITVQLPFTPRIVLVSGVYPLSNTSYSVFSVAFGPYCHEFFGEGNSAKGHIQIVENGFQASSYQNGPAQEHHYIAIR